MFRGGSSVLCYATRLLVFESPLTSAFHTNCRHSFALLLWNSSTMLYITIYFKNIVLSYSHLISQFSIFYSYFPPYLPTHYRQEGTPLSFFLWNNFIFAIAHILAFYVLFFHLPISDGILLLTFLLAVYYFIL